MVEYRIQYKTANNIVYSCTYCVVWCPKYRRPVLEGDIATRLKEIIQDVCNECRAELFKLKTMPDHVHLVVEVEPQFGIHKLIKRLKGRSSRILRQEFPQLRSRLPTLWTNSYFVSTVGGTPLEVIRQYLAQQKHV